MLFVTKSTRVTLEVIMVQTPEAILKVLNPIQISPEGLGLMVATLIGAVQMVFSPAEIMPQGLELIEEVQEILQRHNNSW